MLQQRSNLRAGALIAASALVLHELRYLVGYGDRAGRGGPAGPRLAALADRFADGIIEGRNGGER